MSRNVHLVFRVLNFLHSAASHPYHLLDIDKLILINLASHDGKKGIFPKQSVIAKEIQKGLSSVERSLLKLKTLKIISIESVGAKKYYTLHVPDITEPLTHEGLDQDITPHQRGVDPSPMRDEPLTHEIPLIIYKNNKGNNKGITKRKTAINVTTRFNEFWSAYPNKKNKSGAEKIWQRDRLDQFADEIIAKVGQQKELESQWQNPQFIPMASTYLNQKRWTDEITPIPKPSPVTRQLDPVNTVRSTVKWFNNNH